MLRLVTALHAEARPLIAHWRLKPVADHDAFKVFARDDVALIVSGIGKAASAAACAYLHLASGGEANAIWLNVGVGGSGAFPVGTAVIAHKIRDRATGTAWYPPLVVDLPLPTGEVLTVDAVERGYAENVVYEMEASGYYATANRFATAELIHSVKVISDGPETVIEEIDARRLTQLIEQHVESLETLIEALADPAAELRGLGVSETLALLTESCRFTSTERHQLRRSLERWNALAPGEPLPMDELLALGRGRDILTKLRKRLGERTPVVG